MARFCRQLNQDFLRTCVSFDDGGDYDVTETQAVRELLQSLQAEFETAAGERQAALSALESQCGSITAMFGESFTKTIDSCVEVRGPRSQPHPLLVALCVHRRVHDSLLLFLFLPRRLGVPELEHGAGYGEEVWRASTECTGGHSVRVRVVGRG